MKDSHDTRRAVDGYRWRRVSSFYLDWTALDAHPHTSWSMAFVGVELWGSVVPAPPIETTWFRYCVSGGLVIRETHGYAKQLMRELVRRHLMPQCYPLFSIKVISIAKALVYNYQSTPIA